MQDSFYRFVSAELMIFAVFWSIYTIFISWGTECFNMFYAYVTIIAFIVQLIWDNLINPKVAK